MQLAKFKCKFRDIWTIVRRYPTSGNNREINRMILEEDFIQSHMYYSFARVSNCVMPRLVNCVIIPRKNGLTSRSRCSAGEDAALNWHVACCWCWSVKSYDRHSVITPFWEPFENTNQDTLVARWKQTRLTENKVANLATEIKCRYTVAISWLATALRHVFWSHLISSHQLQYGIISVRFFQTRFQIGATIDCAVIPFDCFAGTSQLKISLLMHATNDSRWLEAHSWILLISGEMFSLKFAIAHHSNSWIKP